MSSTRVEVAYLVLLAVAATFSMIDSFQPTLLAMTSSGIWSGRS
jgi:hypothetical protein